VRVIAGEFNGDKGPAKTFTSINLWDADLRAGNSAELPLPDGQATTFLVLSGEVVVNGEREASADVVSVVFTLLCPASGCSAQPHRSGLFEISRLYDWLCCQLL
jgi:redox-sensitive bicupin YhaK (pirin superfamily)